MSACASSAVLEPLPAAPKVRPVTHPEWLHAPRFARAAGRQDEPHRVAAAVARARLGDPDAHRWLYERFAADVCHFVRTIVRDEHEAQDVTQLVFERLLHRLDRYEPRETPFVAWLLRVARNAALDHVRARRTVPCEQVRRQDACSDDGARDRPRELRDALQALPVEQRQVIVLRHLLGLSPVEIAARMGRSEASIHGLHHRGRAAMKIELERRDLCPVTAGGA
jgi:RNA polymerase sigma-70 factor (ECF subfamily)